jgi:hypothetical protein
MSSQGASYHFFKRPAIVGRKFDKYVFTLQPPSYCVCPIIIRESQEYKNSIKGGCENNFHDCSKFCIKINIDISIVDDSKQSSVPQLKTFAEQTSQLYNFP